MNWYKLAGKEDILRLLNEDEGKYSKISHFPNNIQPIAAYFFNQTNITNLEQYINKLENLLRRNMIKVSFNGNVPNLDNVQINNWIPFTEIIDGKYNVLQNRENPNLKKDKEVTNFEEKPIASSNNITVYESHSRDKCIHFGAGQSFCISQPGNTMWQSYRDTQASTFYFVFDKNRKPEDPLSVVVVDVTNGSGEENEEESTVLLTDRNNNTGKISEYGNNYSLYFNYLRSKGIDTDIFENNPLTKEEIKETKILGSENEDLQWFINLSPDYKSKYIGRGNKLTDEQFKYIWDNNIDWLIKQYIGTGSELNKYQIQLIKTNKQYLKTYLKNMGNVYAQLNKISPSTLELFLENGMADKKAMITALKTNANSLELLLNRGIVDDELINIALKTNGSVIKFVFDKGLKVSKEMMTNAVNSDYSGKAISEILDHNIVDKELILKAVRKNGNIIKDILKRGIIDKNIIIESLNTNRFDSDNIKYILNAGVRDKDILVTAIQKNPWYGNTVQEILNAGIKDKDVLIAALYSNHRPDVNSTIDFIIKHNLDDKELLKSLLNVRLNDDEVDSVINNYVLQKEFQKRDIDSQVIEKLINEDKSKKQTVNQIAIQKIINNKITDKNILISAINKDSRNKMTKYIIDNQITDPEVLARLTRKEARFWDTEILINILKQGSYNKNILLEAVRQDSGVIDIVLSKGISDKDIMIASISSYRDNFKKIAEHFKQNISKDIMFAGVKDDGNNIRHILNYFNKDELLNNYKDVLLESVKSDGRAIKYIFEKGIIDRDVMLTSMNKIGAAFLTYLQNGISDGTLNKESVLNALSKDVNILNYVKKYIQ
jgi:hypothetical protein